MVRKRERSRGLFFLLYKNQCFVLYQVYMLLLWGNICDANLFSTVREDFMVFGLIKPQSAAVRGGRVWCVRLAAPKLGIVFEAKRGWSAEGIIQFGKTVTDFDPRSSARLLQSIETGTALQDATEEHVRKLARLNEPHLTAALATTDYKTVRGILVPTASLIPATTQETTAMSLKSDFPTAYAAIQNELFANLTANVRLVAVYQATSTNTIKAKRLYTVTSGQACELKAAELDVVAGPLISMMQSHGASNEAQTWGVNEHAAFGVFPLDVNLLGGKSSFAVAIAADASKEWLEGCVREAQAVITKAFEADIDARRRAAAALKDDGYTPAQTASLN
jgi:hypothetical protein